MLFVHKLWVYSSIVYFWHEGNFFWRFVIASYRIYCLGHLTLTLILDNKDLREMLCAHGVHLGIYGFCCQLTQGASHSLPSWAWRWFLSKQESKVQVRTSIYAKRWRFNYCSPNSFYQSPNNSLIASLITTSVYYLCHNVKETLGVWYNIKHMPIWYVCFLFYREISGNFWGV